MIREELDDINGIIVVDKAKGMTSYDVIRLVRSRFKIKKIGHAGTLDPLATGVLVLLLGKATKLADKFINDNKEYSATMKLGERRDSCDSDGKVVDKKEVNVTEEEIHHSVESFKGEIDQITPMFSARKYRGERLYKLARKGININREPVKVNIEKIEIKNVNLPYVSFDVSCSKGTYIRQLVDDIGVSLNCGAYLSELRRTRSGSNTINKAVTVDAISSMDKNSFYANITRI